MVGAAEALLDVSMRGQHGRQHAFAVVERVTALRGDG
jgi:hypothetical protein